MSNNQTMNTAEEIAKLVIDKSYWGNEWFIFFSLLIIGLVAALSSWGGAYLSSRAQNAAIRADFDKALKNLETQTQAVKRIEEDISHNYLQEREIKKIRREKIELLYIALAKEMRQLSHNVRVLATNTTEDVVDSENTVDMLLSLYFKDELVKELEFYREHRNHLLTRIRELSEENLVNPVPGNLIRLEKQSAFIKNYNQAKINIELGLEEIMRNLTS